MSRERKLILLIRIALQMTKILQTSLMSIVAVLKIKGQQVMEAAEIDPSVTI